MKTRNAILLFCALTVALVLFQNCTFETNGVESSAASRTDDNGNGQPYDGKPFIVAAACADGTLVQSRLLLKGAGALLYRESCETIAPREIGALELTFDPGHPDEVTFSGRRYTAEQPAIPLPGVISWYYQLTGTLEPRPASIYIIDLFDNDRAAIDALKAQGHTVICSVSAGTLENWRPDTAAFAPTDLGNPVAGASSERWLDTRSDSVRAAMLARLDLAKAKGCHGIDFDSVDGYLNNSGFALSATTQLEYNRFLAFAAHDRRLILSLNNVPELAGALSQIFDFAIAEECFRYNECASYQPFITRKKPVLAAEYTPLSPQHCDEAKASLISLSYFSTALDGSRFETCP